MSAAAASTKRIRVVQIDLANAHRDECNKDYRYGKRHERMCQFVAELAKQPNPPAIFSFKELRLCRNADDSADLTPHQIAADFAQRSGYGIARLHPVKLAWTSERQKDDTWKRQAAYKPFYLLQLYDPRQLNYDGGAPITAYKTIFGVEDVEQAPHFGGSKLTCIYMGLDADGVPTSSITFAVESHHFHLRPDWKLNAAKHWAVPHYASIPTIRIGDFNLFADDSNKDEIWQALLDDGKWQCASDGMVDMVKPDQAMFGTFYPFPHDKPPVEIATPDQPQGASRLDYAFVRNGAKAVSAGVWRTDCPSDGQVALSDHLPLDVTVEIPLVVV